MTSLRSNRGGVCSLVPVSKNHGFFIHTYNEIFSLVGPRTVGRVRCVDSYEIGATTLLNSPMLPTSNLTLVGSMSRHGAISK